MGSPYLPVARGDVLLVRSGGVAGWAIRFGSALRDQPNLANHVAVVHHTDPKGTTWAYEGRPGGVGLVDARRYLTSPWLLSNAGQPKTTAQRTVICEMVEALNATPYDWAAIAAAAARDLGFRLPGWDRSWHGQVPVHVICSSLAAYGYARAGAACPAGDREVQPSDWEAFVLTRAWTAR